MPELIEAVPGTAFLFPIVWYLVSAEIFPITIVIPIAAFLVFPMGWILLNIQGFIITYFHGRYENEPAVKDIRRNIKIRKINSGRDYYIDLSKVVPSSLGKTTITCCKQEYEKLFDPFKELQCFPCSYRRKQEKKEEEPYYVENVENVTFFTKKDWSSYIREMIRYWHVSYSSLIGVVLGLLVVGELIAVLSRALLLNIIGLTFLTLTIETIIILTGFQSYLRKKEAIANEYLMIKLLMPYTKAPPSTTLTEN